MKSRGSTLGVRPILVPLGQAEADGIPGVAVKCADIRKNAEGESSPLGLRPTLRRESRGSEQD